MPSKKLLGFWWLFNFALLAAAAVTIALSFVWRQPNLLINLVLDNTDLTVGLILGILLAVTWAVSIGAVIQRNHVTGGLVFLNWMLLVDMGYVIAIGTVLWFFTLRELNNFHQVYSQQTDATRIAIQDMFQCCGYFNSTDLVAIGGTFCVDPTFVNQTTNATQSFCWQPITAKADSILNPIFTTVYGFIAILACFFLASACVISERKTEERFKKIDAKRGGRGFV